MFIARETIPIRRRSEERNVSRLVPVKWGPLLRTAPGASYVPVYKHLTPSGVKNPDKIKVQADEARSLWAQTRFGFHPRGGDLAQPKVSE